MLGRKCATAAPLLMLWSGRRHGARVSLTLCWKQNSALRKHMHGGGKSLHFVRPVAHSLIVYVRTHVQYVHWSTWMHLSALVAWSSRFVETAA